MDPISAAPRGKSDTMVVAPEEIDATLARFYGGVRDDPMIGPIFRNAIPVDQWDVHVARINAFWRKVLRNEPGFDGRPMQKHVALGVLEKKHFVRWLGLFEEACRAECSTPSADVWISRAHLIGESLLRGVALHQLPRRQNPPDAT